MALQKQLVSVDLTGGISKKQRNKLLIPGKLEALHNGTFDTGGTFSRRAGSSLVHEGGLQGGGVAVGPTDLLKTLNDELIQGTKDALYSLSGSKGWLVPRGRSSFVSVRKTQVLRNSASQSNVDMAWYGGFGFYAWEDSRGGIRYAVIDDATGTVAVHDTALSATGKMPRVLVTGSFFVVVYIEGANLKSARVNRAAAHGALAFTTHQVNVHATQHVLDAYVPDPNRDEVYVAYQNTTPALSRFTFEAGAATGAAVNLALVNNTNAVAISRTTDARLQTWYSEQGVGIRVLADTTAGTVTTNAAAPATADAGVGPGASKQLTAVENTTVNQAVAVYWSSLGGGAPGTILRIATASSVAIPIGAAELIRHSQLGGSILKWGSKLYVPLIFDSALQAAFFLIEVETRSVVARALPLSGVAPAGGGAFIRLGSMVTTPALGASLLSVPVLEKGRLEVQSGVNVTTTGVARLKLTMDRADQMPPVIHADQLHLPGAAPLSYDGVGATELGFNVYPEAMIVNNLGAGNVNAGTRQLVAIYEWTDGRGNRHQSAASIKVEFIAGVASNLSVAIQTLTLTEKYDNSGLTWKPVVRGNVQVVLYATEANGQIFYRVGAVANDPLANTVAVAYNFNDATLIGNEILYTTGELDHFPPPACRVACVHENRLVVGGTEDDGVYLSQQFVEGKGLAFHPNLKLRVPSAGGEVTAVASFQEKLVIFKSDTYFVVYGAGPNAAGLGSSFTVVQAQNTDVGCVSPASIVLAPDGLWFKSRGGFRRLNPDLTVDLVAGAEMDAYAAQDVTSGVLVPDKKQIRWTSTSAEAACIVYDYFWKQWSVFDYWWAKDACLWDNVYVRAGELVLGNGITVAKEDAAQSQDRYSAAGALNYTLYWITGPLKVAGVQGFQRIYRVLLEGENFAGANIDLSAKWDYGEGGTTVELAGVAMPARQLRHHLSRQKCRAVAFIVAVTGGIPGLQFDNLTLEVGLKKGAFKREQT